MPISMDIHTHNQLRSGQFCKAAHTAGIRTWRIGILSIGIGTLLDKAQRADPKEAGRGASPRAISDRNRGRDHLGMVGDFISESRAISLGINKSAQKRLLFLLRPQQLAFCRSVIRECKKDRHVRSNYIVQRKPCKVPIRPRRARRPHELYYRRAVRLQLIGIWQYDFERSEFEHSSWSPQSSTMLINGTLSESNRTACRLTLYPT
jgi:hypothetical protein